MMCQCCGIWLLTHEHKGSFLPVTCNQTGWRLQRHLSCFCCAELRGHGSLPGGAGRGPRVRCLVSCGVLPRQQAAGAAWKTCTGHMSGSNLCERLCFRFHGHGAIRLE